MADPEPLPVPALPAGPPSRVLGSLGEFDPKAEGISSYLERVQLYFEANSVEDDRKVPVLLTVVGAKTYETLQSLLAPTRPREKSFIDLIEVLKRHFDPQPLVIGERFRFYQRSQKSSETIADFVADLRRLGLHCEFGDFLDQALRDRFVCGVKREALQRRLLTEADLTIKRAQDIAQNMESADINAKELKADGQARFTDSVHLATTQRQEKRRPCYRCGRSHEADQCKFKEAKCYKCGKQGHIAPVCRTATTPPVDRPKRRPYQRRRAGGTKWLEAEMEQWDPLPLFVLSGDAPQPPILVTILSATLL